MNKTWKLVFDSFFYGTAVAGMFAWLYTMGVASQTNWILVMDFNRYGEAWLEYIWALGWVVIAISKAFIFMGENWMKKEEKNA